MVYNPVTDLKAGGTWGLEKGQVLLFLFTLHYREGENSFNKDRDVISHPFSL
jgi:hypothetical protein